MPRRLTVLFAMTAVIGMAGCTYEENPAPANTTVGVRSPVTFMATEVAPSPPPPPHAALVPPPPRGAPEVWQPGHWRYAGGPNKPWIWASGHYVAPPAGENTWVPGRWAQQPNGQWQWVSGYWA